MSLVSIVVVVVSFLAEQSGDHPVWDCTLTRPFLRVRRLCVRPLKRKEVIIPPYGQPHAVFGRLISVSGGCLPLCKELIMTEDIYHITMQC